MHQRPIVTQHAVHGSLVQCFDDQVPRLGFSVGRLRLQGLGETQRGDLVRILNERREFSPRRHPDIKPSDVCLAVAEKADGPPRSNLRPCSAQDRRRTGRSEFQLQLRLGANPAELLERSVEDAGTPNRVSCRQKIIVGDDDQTQRGGCGLCTMVGHCVVTHQPIAAAEQFDDQP